MKKITKKKQDITVSPAPIEAIIPLLDPVKIYTPKELAAMPLSVMNKAIEAQEAYFILEHTTQMGGASHSDTSPNARRYSTYPGERKVTYPVQNQQRICRTSNYSPVRKTRPSEVGWAVKMNQLFVFNFFLNLFVVFLLESKKFRHNKINIFWKYCNYNILVLARLKILNIWVNYRNGVVFIYKNIQCFTFFKKCHFIGFLVDFDQFTDLGSPLQAPLKEVISHA